ncbi:methylosome subunit pICln isoform X1 [Dermacentor silvarum]|uniref:methylosome subunit pICln isoform X1 n=2 Tax=Dermacentor silvarum TaxID=543639 RepID=UPI00189B2C6B|nr:methylosome subunit pICln isoform X1 [Dermacentor silvarum]
MRYFCINQLATLEAAKGCTHEARFSTFQERLPSSRTWLHCSLDSMVILTSFPPPDEGIRHREEATAAFIQSRDLGKGTLYIAESRVSWVGQNSSGFSLEYPSVALHALSRDLRAFPEECLYLMIDGDLGEGEEESSENGQDDEQPASEIRFVPDDKSHLEAMYKAMSECQALHPDPADVGDSDDDGVYEDADEEDEGAEYDVRAAEQQRGCHQLEADAGNGDWEAGDEPMETGQFEDAEPDH